MRSRINERFATISTFFSSVFRTGDGYSRVECLRGKFSGAILLSMAPMALLEGTDRSQEIDLTKLGPENVREVKFAVGTLP